MNTSAAHTSEISMVWPKSGCRMSGTIVAGSNRKAMARAINLGAPGRAPSASAQAVSTMKAGLMNSEGCRPSIQRREPFTSAPNISAAKISARLTANMINAARRTWRGARNDDATSRTAVGGASKAWRLTKWNVDSPSRSATAGLAANAITTPNSMRAPKAASSQPSTLRNQSATGPRSVLETISGSLAMRLGAR